MRKSLTSALFPLALVCSTTSWGAPYILSDVFSDDDSIILNIYDQGPNQALRYRQYGPVTFSESGIYDFYDARLTAFGLDLPNDRWDPPSPWTPPNANPGVVYTAGAIFPAEQDLFDVPEPPGCVLLASMAGAVLLALRKRLLTRRTR